jgi:hypothetical protein
VHDGDPTHKPNGRKSSSWLLVLGSSRLGALSESHERARDYVISEWITFPNVCICGRRQLLVKSCSFVECPQGTSPAAQLRMLVLLASGPLALRWEELRGPRIIVFGVGTLKYDMGVPLGTKIYCL